MEICIKWNICRLCLQEESKGAKDTNAQLLNIFNETDLDRQIFECAGVTVKKNDSLPEKICRRCLMSIRQWLVFRRTCSKSNDYLVTIIQRMKSASTFLKLDREDKAATVNDELNLSDTSFGYAFSEDEGTNISNENDIDGNYGTCIQRSSNKEDGKEKVDTVDVSTNSCPVESREEETQIPDPNGDSDLDQIIVMQQDKNESHEISQDVEESLHITSLTDDDKKITQDFEIINEPTHDDRDKDVLEDATAKLHDDDSKAQSDSCEESKLRNENGDIYLFLNEVDHVEQDQEQQSQHEEQPHHENSTSDHPSEEYVCMVDEGDNNGDLEILDELEEDNPQVTSTVLIKEESTGINFEIEEENSNISYNTHDSSTIQYVVGEYVVDDKINVRPSKSHNVIPTTITVKAKESTFISKSDECLNNTTNTLRRRTNGKVSFTINGSTKDSVFICYICSNQFSNRQLLKAHLKIHRQEKTHECELCFKRFITACNLQAHMRIHTGEKPFECQYCGRRFTDRSTHLRHERVHTNEKPFTCDLCGRSFTLATTLQAHKRVHTGERPFKCEPCAKSFKLSHQLKAHQNTHLHKTVEQSTS